MVNKEKEKLVTEYIRNNPGCGSDIPKILLAAIWALDGNARPSYDVEVVIFFKDNSKPRDIVNFEKLATDFLVGRGFILDDCLIDRFTIVRGKTDKVNPRMEYTIKNLNEK